MADRPELLSCNISHPIVEHGTIGLSDNCRGDRRGRSDAVRALAEDAEHSEGAKDEEVTAEITPAMIEAGLPHLFLYEPAEDTEEGVAYVVSSIFRAMRAAQLKANGV